MSTSPVLLIFFCLFCSHSTLSKLTIDLSPANWPQQTLDTFYNLLNDFNPKPQSSSNIGIVSATSSAPASHVGQQVLTKGGNAVDAAIATSLSQVVLAASSYVSFAGITNIIFYNATTNKIININGEWNNIPTNNISKISSNPMEYNDEYPVGASVLTPGYFKAIYSVYQKYSNIDWKSLLQPAIYWAQNGFPLPEQLYYLPRLNAEVLNRTTEGQQFYQYITSLNIGDTFVQTELAEFLTKISTQGSDYIYNGEWGQNMVNMVRTYGGNITIADLTNYDELYLEPTMTEYDVYNVYSSNISYNNGPVDLFEQENILSTSGIYKYGTDYGNNATILAYMMEMTRWSTAIDDELVYGGNLDRIKYWFNEQMPIFPLSALESYQSLQEYRITKDHAEIMWNIFSNTTALQQLNGILEQIFGPHSISAKRGKHSDSIVTIDKDGNMISMVHTINSEPWGTGIFVQGVALSNAASINYYYIKNWIIQQNITKATRILGPIQPMIGVNNKDGKGLFGISCIAGSLRVGSFQLLSLLMLWNKSSINAMDYSFYQPSSTSAGLALGLTVYVKNPCNSNDTQCIDNNIKYGAMNETVVALLLNDEKINDIIDGNVQVLFQNVNMATFAGPVIGSILENGTRTGSTCPKLNGWSDSV